MVHVKPVPSTFGERLRAERERLGFTQAELANLAGIHRNTQARYENANTHPTPLYLDAIRPLGADVEYVMTGQRARADDLDTRYRALRHLVGVILDALQITHLESEFGEVCRLAYEEESALWQGGKVGSAADNAVAALVAKSPIVIDEAAFVDLVERVEFVLESKEIDLPPYAKARALLQLYALARTEGKPLDLQAVLSVVETVR